MRLDVEGIADAVASEMDPDRALDRAVAELAAALGTRGCLLRRGQRGWVVVSQSGGGTGAAMSDLLLALANLLPEDRISRIDLGSIDDGTWTAVVLELPAARSVLLLAGDWTHLESLADLRLVLTYLLRSAHDRRAGARADRLLVGQYALGRRLSRLGGVDRVAARIVRHVSRSLRADRVTLALYRPAENRVAIAATYPHSLSHAQEIVIEPGAWVIGHVYASGRPVLVRDVRELPSRTERAQYRTFSFAAVPLVAGRDPIGVLAATDKRDGSAFDRVDLTALRSFGASASLALQAAASDAEAQRLAHAATVDVLTGLFNRPYLDARLHQEVGRARRLSSTMALMLIDVDDFKSINDTHGHQVGDGVLQSVGDVLRSSVRVFDVCARYGGDEFAVLMPGSDRASALACAERMRGRVAEAAGGGHPVAGAAAGRRVPNVTISLGVTVIEPGDAPAELIRRADRSLYAAKAAGKNRVEAGVADAPRLPLDVPRSSEVV